MPGLHKPSGLPWGTVLTHNYTERFVGQNQETSQREEVTLSTMGHPLFTRGKRCRQELKKRERMERMTGSVSR